MTSTDTAKHVNTEMEEEKEEEKKISTETVRKIAHRVGYFACRPLLKSLLIKYRKTARLEFARVHQDRTMHYRRNVIFIDETYIKLAPKTLVKGFGERRGSDWQRKISFHQLSMEEKELCCGVVCHGWLSPDSWYTKRQRVLKFS